MCNQSKLNLHFFYKDIYSKGGAPEDYYKLAKYLSPFSCKITSSQPISDFKPSFPHLKLREILFLKLKKKLPVNFVGLIICFSSLQSFYIALLCKVFSVKYILLPVNQINTFLDKDNPFDKNDVPIVNDIINNSKGNKLNVKTSFSRVKNGRHDLQSNLNFLKRHIFRKTFGYLIVKYASAIGVFSDFESNNIRGLYPKITLKFIHYSLGADIEGRLIGNDKIKDKKSINFLMWCRVDPYYKGIFKLISMLENIPKSNLTNLTINVAGPDYNAGLLSLQKRLQNSPLKDLDIFRYIDPLDCTPNSLTLMNDSDAIISFSLWDGFPRTLREACLLGIPVVTNNESNFDRVLNKYNNGVIINSSKELCELILTLERSNLCFNEIKDNAFKCRDALSWENTSLEFYSDIIELLKSKK